MLEHTIQYFHIKEVLTLLGTPVGARVAAAALGSMRFDGGC